MQEIFLRNDFCIREMLAHLPLEDLANIARVNFFKNNAEMTFRDNHAATIEIEYDPDNFPKQEMIFQIFGGLAKNVSIRMKPTDEDDMFHSDGDKVLRMIGRFCGANLKTLTLALMQIDFTSENYSSNERKEVFKLLSTIEKLRLFSVCAKGGLLKSTRSLRELFIHSCCHMEALPELVTLPELRSVEIGACPSWPFIVGDIFNSFLKMNPSIEKVSYDFFYNNNAHLKEICKLPRLTHLEVVALNTNVFTTIADNARKLKELTVHVLPSDHGRFLSFKNRLPSGCSYTVEKLGTRE